MATRRLWRRVASLARGFREARFELSLLLWMWWCEQDLEAGSGRGDARVPDVLLWSYCLSTSLTTASLSNTSPTALTLAVGSADSRASLSHCIIELKTTLTGSPTFVFCSLVHSFMVIIPFLSLFLSFFLLFFLST